MSKLLGRAFLTSDFCGLIFGFAFCLSLPAGPATVAGTPLPSRNMAKGVHYVGSRTCATCHAAIYKSFTQTGMGRSMALSQ